ncbi:DNA repair protein RecO [Parvularcula bermudensis HTCC2503]|uniref:DNA repair protein RecO n=1 Tax=Parvularcula bermudensis (strain ATCC BAA-594 / HTCC2503 / KCTC 12087) TaxID=314260 RepID=E0TBD9_PARBH|nr:DNA repair protein RecO [Parvularcula bermudensis]ADM09736.1 DNA repair protein RecO [Parvularcula bermudensis HTCC2503]
MVEWTDRGFVIKTIPRGENHLVVTLFTRCRGAVTGLVHGGQGTRKAPLLQRGNLVSADWSSRQADGYGTYRLELAEAIAARALDSRLSLLALQSVTDLLCEILPEGVAYEGLFDATEVFFSALGEKAIMATLLVKWELGLLAALGYGLSLERCAATGRTLEDGADLVFVSPKSGGAVTAEAGAPYADRLLPLPPFLIDRGEPTWPDIAAGLRLTGTFLDERLLAPVGKSLPEARGQLIRRLTR